MMSMTGILRRADHPDGPPAAWFVEYNGVLGEHTLVGFNDAAHEAIALTLRSNGIQSGFGALYHRGQGRFVGSLTVDGVAFEAIASPVGFGLDRHWEITLHERSA